MKTIIAGSRTINNKEFVRYCCRMSEFKITEIVCGMANGPDLLGKELAEESSIPVKEFKAQWEKFGKSSGYKRNREMGEYCDQAIIIWDGESKGTRHMINIMEELRKPFFLVTIQHNKPWKFNPETMS